MGPKHGVPRRCPCKLKLQESKQHNSEFKSTQMTWSYLPTPILTSHEKIQKESIDHTVHTKWQYKPETWSCNHVKRSRDLDDKCWQMNNPPPHVLRQGHWQGAHQCTC